MPSFRDHTPKRRNITRTVITHRDHKPDLKADFISRCGYCNSSDTWKVTYYEVDHFIPEAILTTKANTDYSNLVYSCRSCNNAKRKKWPTNDENFSHRNNEGFIDPCDDEYLNQFSRNNTGEILYNSELGKWMYYALKLHKPQHGVIWNLEQLEPLIAEIKALTDLINIPENIKDMIIQVFIKYDNYRNELRTP
ncbi:MAG: HNH endonuclease signature motif containing protein [Daejeonella sp.]